MDPFHAPLTFIRNCAAGFFKKTFNLRFGPGLGQISRLCSPQRSG